MQGLIFAMLLHFSFSFSLSLSLSLSLTIYINPSIRAECDTKSMF